MLSAGIVELDDFYMGTRGTGRPGRGTGRQPMVCAVERARAGRGPCVLRVVPDCSGDAYRAFARDHLRQGSEVRADGWSGITAGLSGWGGLEQREFDDADADASLPMAHKVISNFKAWVEGTFHGLSREMLQAYADEYSWRYSHRASPDSVRDLAEAACSARVPRGELAGLFAPLAAMRC